MAFTIVFPGAAKKFDGNPFKIETPFGKAQTVSVGDVCAYEEILREALGDILDGPLSATTMQDVAQKALDKVDALMMAELKS